MITLRTFAAKYSVCLRLLFLLAIFSFSVSHAAAIPVSEYHSTIESAISEMGALVGRDGHESDADYESRLNITVEKVRSAFPMSQPVELEKGTWTTDNTWLHAALDDLLRANVEDRSIKLTGVLEWLLALDDRLTELENAEKVDDHKGAAKQKLESILARPEYASASRGPTALTRLIRDFIRWIESLLPDLPDAQPGRPSFGSYVVMIAIVALAVLIVVYVGWLLFRRFKQPVKLRVRKKREARIVLGERLRPEDTATDLLAEAEALARNGDLRAAIRKGYIALLVELGDRNVISLAQYKTNRDYLRSVSSRPQLYSPLRRLTESFERHWYGFAQATPNDWQDFRAGYREALQTGN